MGEEGFVVRCRGLPWTATPEDVYKFFEGCQINRGQEGVHLTQSRDGRPSGEAFVEFASEEDVQMALKKNKEHIGSRYIEVFRSKQGEMDWVVKRSGIETNNLADAVVKLRGVPFGCSKEEIAQFFTGLEIVPNGIMLPEDRLGRSTGEAFVQFASQDIAERALGKHKDRIGHRYIEIFKSSMGEAQAVTGRDRGFRSMGRPGPYDRGDRFGGGPMGPGGFNRGRGGRNVKGFYDEEYDDFNGGGFGYGGRGRGGMRGMDDRGPGSQYVSKTGHAVHMRGLPFQAQEQDVFDFFSPLQPVRVTFEFTSVGRPTGGANVDFATHQEAMEAMKKHKSNMQHRYIELFLKSSDSSQNGTSMGGYDGSVMGSGFANSMGGDSYSSNIGGYGNGSSSMGGNYMSGSGNMGSYDSQSGQYGSSQQYSSNMGGGSYGMGSSSQGDGYAGQGYMGNSGSGYSGMSSLGSSNYTAF